MRDNTKVRICKTEIDYEGKRVSRFVIKHASSGKYFRSIGGFVADNALQASHFVTIDALLATIKARGDLELVS